MSMGGIDKDIDEYFFRHKMKETLTGDSMDELWGHYAKRNHSDKDKYCVISLICGLFKKQIHHSSNSKEKETKGIQIEKQVKV